MTPRRPPDEESPRRFHRRATDPEDGPIPGIPHRRANDKGLTARLKEWASVIGAGGVVLMLLASVFTRLGGQAVFPNDRAGQVESRVDKIDTRVTALETGQARTTQTILDSVTKLIRQLDDKANVLTVSRCLSGEPVTPARLRTVCESLGVDYQPRGGRP